MATKYWRSVITSGTWGTAANWSTTSHTGAANTTIPTSSDNVIIPNGVTVNSTATSNVCGTLTFSEFGSVSPTLNVNSTLTINGPATGTPQIGGLTLRSNTIISSTVSTGVIVFNNNTGNTIRIDTAGVTLGCNIRFGISGTTPTSVLQNNITIANNKLCTLLSGTLTLNNFNLSCGSFISTGSLTRRIDFTQNPEVDPISNIYVTSISTADILDLDGTNFSFTGQSSFILIGNTTSTTVSTIGTIAAPVNVKIAPPPTYDGNGIRIRTGIIAIDTGSNFLSLDLSECSGSFLITVRIINLYGPFDIGFDCISNGTISAGFTFQLRDRPVGALPTINTLVNGPIPIMFRYNASSQRGIRIGDLTVLGGDYIIDSTTDLADNLVVSGGKVTINDTVDVAGDLTISAGTLVLSNFSLLTLTAGDVYHSGGTLEFLNFDCMYVLAGNFNASGTGILDLGSISDNSIQRFFVQNFITTSSSYTIKAYTKYDPAALSLPSQIGVNGSTGATNIISAPNIIGGDVGFYSNNTGGSVAFTDNSGKFYYTFAGSSLKVTIGTCSIKGLDTYFEGGVIALATGGATATIAGPLIAYNTFSGGTNFNFNLNGTGTELKPNKFEVDGIIPATYNINSGHYNINTTNIETIGGSVNIASGATLRTGTASIKCTGFTCRGTLKHNNGLAVYLLSSGAVNASPISLHQGSTLLSTDGITSGTVYLQYEGTSTSTRLLDSSATGTNAADYLNLIEYSGFTGSNDNTRLSGSWRNIDTTQKATASFVFDNVEIYGNLQHRNAVGNVKFVGSSNTIAQSSGVGFSDLSQVVVEKSIGASVTFLHSVISRPVAVTSGTLILNNSSMNINRSISVGPNGFLNIANDIRLLSSTLTLESGATVIPNQSSIFLDNTTLNGNGDYYNIRPISENNVINGNNKINSLLITGIGSGLLITGNNEIQNISKVSASGSTPSSIFFGNQTENIVNNITGLNSGFILNLRQSSLGGPRAKIRRETLTPWELGVGSTLNNVTGASATGNIVNQLNVTGIDFLTGELVVASNFDKFFLFF